MKWYMIDKNGKKQVIKPENIGNRLTDWQVKEAIYTKHIDPLAKVSYNIGNGCSIIYDN